MISPPFLRPGARVALAATARPVTDVQIQTAVSWLEERGYRVVLAANLRSKHSVFAGPAAERASALQTLLDSSDIAAIWFLRGGYGTTPLLTYLDWRGYRKSPKWLVGYSDLTALLNTSLVHGVAALHGPLAAELESPELHPSIEATWQALEFGPSPLTAVPGNPAAEQMNTRNFSVMGGNLAVLQALLGTPFLPSSAGMGLLLEDVDEYRYATHRRLVHLAQAGAFAHCKAILLGTFANEQDNPEPFGLDPRGMLDDICPQVPCFHVTVGHGKHNPPVVLGSQIQLQLRTPS